MAGSVLDLALSFSFFLSALVAFLGSALFFFFLSSSSSVSSGHGLDPTAGHHVTNRAMLQRVFQVWLVWIQDKDWRAGLS